MENKDLVDQINNLNKEYQYEIFKIIKKNNIPYTENNNGIFINFKELTCIDELIKYINFIKDNKKKLEEFEKIKEINRKKLTYINNNSITNDDIEDTLNEEDIINND